MSRDINLLREIRVQLFLACIKGGASSLCVEIPAKEARHLLIRIDKRLGRENQLAGKSSNPKQERRQHESNTKTRKPDNS